MGQTKIIEPPFLGDEARRIVATVYEDEQFTIPLELEPLSEPGTRVIIPYLSDEAVEAVRNGELAHWLQAEWWRPIQKGELEISVTGEDGLTRAIGVPDFWQGQPWDNGDTRYYARAQIELPSHSQDDPCLIKRVVLFHDSELAIEDFEGPAQFHGVQLLRGGQWIVTLEMGEFSDWIPKEQRGGFRGFVEFDRLLERQLRQLENPAHDGYNRRMRLYREIVQTTTGRAIGVGVGSAECGCTERLSTPFAIKYGSLHPSRGGTTPRTLSTILNSMLWFKSSLGSTWPLSQADSHSQT